MFQNFRLSMAWLHTWFGLVLGFVLMAAFFFGALSVFDREIDRWAIPASRFEPTPMPSYDQILKPVFESMQPNAQAREAMRGEVNGPLPERFDTPQRWGAYTTHRDPVLGLFAGYEVANAKKPETLIWAMRTIDPRNGESLPDDHLKIGSQFFYPLHYSLTLNWMGLGYWIVGFAALIMLVALVSGVVMHRKIFRELFTFRPKKATQRSVLDLHNMTGVVALPFHFFFAFTGLVIFAGIYFPITHTQLEPLHELHEKMEAEETGLPHDRAGVAAPVASVDAMVAEAQRRWAAKGMAGDVGFLSVTHVGDANGYVSVYRAGTDRIALTGEGIHFKASTGALLREDPPRTAVDSLNTFLTGLHLQHFRHWLLRWLYVLGGLAGSQVSKNERALGAVVGAGAGAAAGSYIGCNQQRARSANQAAANSYRATSNLRIRTGPGANYRQTGSLSAGQPFTAVGSQGEWVQIAGGGWVNARYVAQN